MGIDQPKALPLDLAMLRMLYFLNYDGQNEYIFIACTRIVELYQTRLQSVAVAFLFRTDRMDRQRWLRSWYDHIHTQSTAITIVLYLGSQHNNLFLGCLDTW